MSKGSQPKPSEIMKEKFELPIGDRIRILREQAGLTQQALAEQTRFSKAQIGQWELGRRNPGVDSLRGLAVALDGSFLWLALGQGDSREDNQPNGPLLEACVEIALMKAGPEGAPAIAAQLFQKAYAVGLGTKQGLRSDFIKLIRTLEDP